LAGLTERFKEDTMTHPDRAEEPAARKRQGMPRWVIGFIIAGAVVAALVVLMLALGHGPRQHSPSHSSAPASAVSSGAWSRW
jgi:hypothetical protein